MQCQLYARVRTHNRANPQKRQHRYGYACFLFKDRRGDAATLRNISPHAKPGRQQPPKSGKRKNDTLSKQSKMLSALSGAAGSPSKGQSKSEADDGQSSDVTVVKRASVQEKTKKKASPLEGSIYEHPAIYDWAFGFRAYEAEVDFLFDVYEEVIGEEPLSFLEVGSGPAQHSMEMAESKLNIFCVDSSQEMLEYAAQMAEADDIELQQIRADMRTFSLPDGEKVDLAACLLGTLQHMLTTEDVLKTFERVKNALVPHGLFFIELNHPSQLFDGGIVASADTWSIEVEDAQLEVWWGREGDVYDPFTQVLEKSIEIDVMLRGGERRVLRDDVPLRQFTYQEMLLLANAAGFKVIRTYTEFSQTAQVGAEVEDGAESVLESKVTVDASMQNQLKKAAEEDEEEPSRMILVLQNQQGTETEERQS